MGEETKTAEEKKAKRVYTLEDIKYSDKSKTTAILGCIPVIDIVLALVEKEDSFVKYMATQMGIITLGSMVLSGFIHILGLIHFVVMIVAIVKICQKERLDIPGVSTLALKIMSNI